MRTARHSRQRGAASVEAAISMLIIIPAFMYALFLDDLLRYAGDLQEAVVSTPWDFAGQNYTQPGSRGLGSHKPKSEPNGGMTLTQHQARLMFCDHESSGDSYSGNADYVNDCDAEDHHKGKALSGHVCWLNHGAKQVTCEPVKPQVGLLGANLYQNYMNEFSKAGGLYECYGREVVENYLLPKSFLQEFAGNQGLSKENWNNNGSSIHDNAQAGDVDTAYYLAEQHFAVLMDSWAVNETPDKTEGEGEEKLTLHVAPGTKSGHLYDRVNHIYAGNTGHKVFSPLVTTFIAQASSKLLSPKVVTDVEGDTLDNPSKPNVSLTELGTSPPEQKIEQDEDSAKYYSTPWKDWASNPYEKTHGKRGKYYMGCKTAQKDKC